MIASSNLLMILSAINIVDAIITIGIHEVNGMLAVWNMLCNSGMYIAHNCSMNESKTAIINVLFVSSLLDLQLNTLKSW